MTAVHGLDAGTTVEHVLREVRGVLALGAAADIAGSAILRRIDAALSADPACGQRGRTGYPTRERRSRVVALVYVTSWTVAPRGRRAVTR